MLIKTATEETEFEQIHELNYKTFVEELPQHERNSEQLLIDPFHEKNHYIIAKRDGLVIGMVSYNFERPFSLDKKLTGLDEYIPPYNKLAEIRLLSVLPTERKSFVTYRLFQQLGIKLLSEGADAAVISGTTLQLALYEKVGFIPFGPLVGKPGAIFQPMFINVNQLRNDFRIN
jgi:predicted N-acetyltransferase YhbS